MQVVNKKVRNFMGQRKAAFIVRICPIQQYKALAGVCDHASMEWPVLTTTKLAGNASSLKPFLGIADPEPRQLHDCEWQRPEDRAFETAGERLRATSGSPEALRNLL
jgi:hypothetical protein